MRVEVLDLNGPCEKRVFCWAGPVIDCLQIIDLVAEVWWGRGRSGVLTQERLPRAPTGAVPTASGAETLATHAAFDPCAAPFANHRYRVVKRAADVSERGALSSSCSPAVLKPRENLPESGCRVGVENVKNLHLFSTLLLRRAGNL
jgi:hypothetical protein